MNYGRALLSATLLLGLAACGGGGGGGGGLPDGMIVNTSGTVASTQPTLSYPFGATQNQAYSARLVSTTGDADLFIATTHPAGTSPSFLDYSMSSGVDDVSFIAPTTTTLYAWVDGWDPSSSFTLQVFNNHLSADGPSRTRQIKSIPIYFSFDAVAGQAYNVKVTPINGDPRLRVYTGAEPDWLFPSGLVPDTATLVGESNNTGTQAESVIFVASETKTHYLTVSNTDTSVDIAFSASVETSDATADLQVSVNSISYSSGNITVNYTVSNTGVANSTPVNVHFWLDSATPPAAGTTGDDQVSIAGIAPGASYTANRTINVGTLEFGTLYAYVDPEEALAEADESNNVSAGRPWAAPVQAPQSFDFEDSLTPSAFTFGGNADWSVVSGGAYGTSNYSFRSGTVTANQTSCFEVAATGVKTVLFDWKALKDYSTDYLYFYANGYVVHTYGGADTWESATYTPYSTSLNTFKWCYVKGSSDNTAVADGGWVDNIVLQPELPDLSVAINSVSSDGMDLTIGYTVSNHTGAAAAASTVDFWADLAAAPTVGTAGGVQVAIPVIAGNGSHTGTVTVPSAAASGTAYAIVDNANTLSEQNETNNVSVGKPWVYYGDPLAVYDFEDSALPASFTASGNAGWEIDATTASSGTKSIRASTISHSQSACIAVTVADSSAITFDWKVSSESCCDHLRFSIDDVLQHSISGTVAWTGKEYTGLAVGTHEYKWCYVKDSSVSTGSDTGWVDNIRIY